MDAARARRLANAWPYRRLLAPALAAVERGRKRSRRKNGDSPRPIYPRPHRTLRDTPEQIALADRISAIDWYHSIDLGAGVWTPGQYDHTPALPLYPIPTDLTGMRCLDIATMDGFWAFEMERRGAQEVVALDIASFSDLDLPEFKLNELREKGGLPETGKGFELASKILQSRVQRSICNAYDLSPAKYGTFDLVFCGDLMVHLSNPVQVLRNIFSVTRGSAIIVEPCRPALAAAHLGAVGRLVADLDACQWWDFTPAFLESVIRAAGFRNVEQVAEIDIRWRRAPEVSTPRAAFVAYD
jgi:tRNA (mo5U34)-methyltransferase